MTRLRNIGVWIALAAVFIYMFIAHGLEGRWYTVLLTLFDIGGLTLSFMLVQKTAGVHTLIHDHVCGVLQKGGCDDILATRASRPRFWPPSQSGKNFGRRPYGVIFSFFCRRIRCNTKKILIFTPL